jgi:hypothetical protein
MGMVLAWDPESQVMLATSVLNSRLTQTRFCIELLYISSFNKLKDNKCWRFSIFLLKILAGSGDMKAVRLWDCRTEMKLIDFPSGTDSFVTRYINLPVKHSKLCTVGTVSSFSSFVGKPDPMLLSTFSW